MGTDRREGAKGTYMDMEYPWGWYRGGRVLCSDGKIRNLKWVSETADTFFSVPATVKVSGKSVAGYVTTETMSGLSTETPDDPMVYKFIAHSYGKNGHLLPGLAYREPTDV